MHYAEPSQEGRSATQQRTMGLAWLTLLFFFALFMGLLIWAGLTVRGVYQHATRPQGGTLVVRGPSDWVAWRPVDRTLYQAAVDGQVLAEGDAVRAVTGGGYGQVASISLFDESQLDLWAGAEVVLETVRTSRWHSGTLELVVHQQAGYIRYDMKAGQPFEQVIFNVRIGDALVQLAPGGSYSIAMQESTRSVARADDGNNLEADVAVRSGTARIIGANGAVVQLRARERALVDAAGAPGLAVPARWDLVRDGGFSQFSELEYNNTTSADPTDPQSEYWKVYSGPDLPLEYQGFFRLSQICRPPIVDNSCGQSERRTAAWFYRAGGQTSSFLVGIQQELGDAGAGVDISEFRSLEFSLWARVLHQSLPGAGDRGSECPVMIRLVAKRDNPASPEEQRVLCVYIGPEGVEPAVKEPGMKYEQITQAEWEQIRIDLRDAEWLENYRYLRRVEIFAQGHDYDSRVAEVSLVGAQ